MFTGIIELAGRVVALHDAPGQRRLVIAAPWDDVKHGQSIAVNGVCLTVAEISSGVIGFDVITQTLSVTNLAALKTGDHVNLERSLRLGDRIDGHFVQGHVDATAALLKIEPSPGETRLTIETPAALRDYLSPRGSVCVDGVSLTIAELHEDSFEVALIPTTLSLTTLGSRAAGWRFNLEADALAKIVVNHLRRGSTAT